VKTAWQEARSTWLTADESPRNREETVTGRRKRSALERADAAFEKTCAVGHPHEQPLAVVAMRQEWLRHRLRTHLEAQGQHVLVVDDGADALGTCAASSPDLLVCEQPLPSLVTSDLVRWLHVLCPQLRIVVQLDDPSTAGAILDAGAAAVTSRSTGVEELFRLVHP